MIFSRILARDVPFSDTGDTEQHPGDIWVVSVLTLDTGGISSRDGQARLGDLTSNLNLWEIPGHWAEMSI